MSADVILQFLFLISDKLMQHLIHWLYLQLGTGIGCGFKKICLKLMEWRYRATIEGFVPALYLLTLKIFLFVCICTLQLK